MRRDCAAVLLAAGRGTRLGRGNKALVDLAGEALVAHAARALLEAPSVGELILVMSPGDEEALRERWGLDGAALGASRVVPGGAERWLSSRAGCEAADPALPLLLVHDAARPLLLSETVEAVAAAVREFGSALAAAPLHDTLKRADSEGRIAATLAREGLWRAQTPQGAWRDHLLAAFSAWDPARGLPTDEAMLLEAAGHHPVLVPAPEDNLKITSPPELELAALLLRRRSAPQA